MCNHVQPGPTKHPGTLAPSPLSLHVAFFKMCFLVGWLGLAPLCSVWVFRPYVVPARWGLRVWFGFGLVSVISWAAMWISLHQWSQNFIVESTLRLEFGLGARGRLQAGTPNYPFLERLAVCQTTGGAACRHRSTWRSNQGQFTRGCLRFLGQPRCGDAPVIPSGH